MLTPLAHDDAQTKNKKNSFPSWSSRARSLARDKRLSSCHARRCGSGVVPVLLSEISSAKSRGAVGSIHQLMINLGILCSGLLGYALVEDVPHGWRYVQGFIAVPAVAQVRGVRLHTHRAVPGCAERFNKEKA